ncbi:hypothetical protein FIU82_18285 (plasmid) [Pseudoalteromonas sp. THAF3]|nr:hypothetical protein FIU82_18285 [Pseudoalteromonas sp. THAF3]
MLFILQVVSFLGFIYFKLFASTKNGPATWLFYIASVIFGVFSMNVYMENEEKFYLGVISILIFTITIYFISMKINKK